MLFGKESKASEPQLVNLPEVIIVQSANATKEKETVEFYLVETRGIRILDGKRFYPMDSRLQALDEIHLIHATEDPRGLAYFRGYTSGRETLWMLELDGVEEPAFTVNDETGEHTFRLAFFRILGQAHMALLRIQAPAEWHRQHGRLDPDISLVWEPEYA